MSENNFDKNIKQKLESIRPEFTEEAWNKFKKVLPVPWYVSLFQNYAGWVVGGFSALALLITNLNNQKLENQNLLLNDKIATLENYTQAKNVNHDTVYINQTDTIFLTKVKKEIVYLPYRGLDVGKKNQNLVANSTEYPLSKNEGLKMDKQKEDGSLSTNKNKTDYKEFSTTESVVSSLNEKSSGTNFPIKSDSLNVKIENISDKLAGTEEVTPKIVDLAAPESTNQAKSKNFLKNINARFGFSFDYMNAKNRSLGPSLEVFLTPRISINTGLFISGNRTIDFRQPKDFNAFTGKRFEDRYRLLFNQRPQKIEDIKIRTSIIKLPVFVTYYIPLNYQVSFMFSTGSRFNISAIEEVSYRGELAGETFLERFENQFKPKVFNSLFYGMGVEYRKNRFVGQLSPYFEFPFRQNYVLNPPNRFGVNASVKLSLRK